MDGDAYTATFPARGTFKLLTRRPNAGDEVAMVVTGMQILIRQSLWTRLAGIDSIRLRTVDVV
jgi:hypothetical protein